MACSLKGNVKRNTSPTTGRGGDFLDFQPCALGDKFCPGTDLTSSLFGMAYMRCDDANRFAKLSKRSGCTVSTMVLSEARGLRLFRVVRGGIGLSQRLGAGGTMSTGHSHTRPRTRASLQNRLLVGRKIGGEAEAVRHRRSSCLLF
jgi:hypothetical protein